MARTLGPDPANAAATTVGGMIGRDSSGSRFLRHGAVRGRILAAQVVLGDGTVVDLEPLSPAQAAGEEPRSPAAALAAGVREIVERQRSTIARHQPATRATHGGYRLADVVRPDGTVDLPRLICGAEGTLGIVTEATFRTVAADPVWDLSALRLLLLPSFRDTAWCTWTAIIAPMQ